VQNENGRAATADMANVAFFALKDLLHGAAM